MKRYHRQIGFGEHDLGDITISINRQPWFITGHAFDKVKYSFEFSELKDLAGFVKSIILQESDIFEYYTDDDDIVEKLCYRVPYSHYQDIILVVTIDKKLITVYLNDVNDKHETLDESIYNKGGVS